MLQLEEAAVIHVCTFEIKNARGPQRARVPDGLYRSNHAQTTQYCIFFPTISKQIVQTDKTLDPNAIMRAGQS